MKIIFVLMLGLNIFTPLGNTKGVNGALEKNKNLKINEANYEGRDGNGYSGRRI